MYTPVLIGKHLASSGQSFRPLIQRDDDANQIQLLIRKDSLLYIIRNIVRADASGKQLLLWSPSHLNGKAKFMSMLIQLIH